MSAEEGKCVVFGLGNLLLDLVVNVPLEFLDKYQMIPDSIQLAEAKHKGLYDDLKMLDPVVYSPGGCALNTIRIAQWILGSPKSTVFVGAVGDDKNSGKLSELLESEGIVLECQKVKNASTGRCAVLINEVTRTLVTELGAAMKFDYEKFESENSLRFLEQAKVVYISGYFLRVSHQTSMKVAERAKQLQLAVVLNLNSVWLTESCKNQIKEITEFVDYLIGNESEIKSFSKDYIGGPVDDLVELTTKLYESLTQKRRMVIIVTRGTDPILCIQDRVLTSYEVIHVPDKKVVDTNGAGDAFAGGLLAGLARSVSLKESIQCGLWAASEVVQQTGCNFPKDKCYTFGSNFNN